MLLLLLPLLGLPLLGLPLILLLLVLLLVVQGWTPQQGVVGLKPMSSKGGTPTAAFSLPSCAFPWTNLLVSSVVRELKPSSGPPSLSLRFDFSTEENTWSVQMTNKCSRRSPAKKNGFKNREFHVAFSGSLYPGDRGGPGITKRTATCTQYTRIMVVEDELSGIQRELSMFPERAFDFQHAGTIVIEQVPPLQHSL